MTQALIEAAESGELKVVVELLKSPLVDGNFIGQVKRGHISLSNYYGKELTFPGTALAAAIINEHWEIAELLLMHPQICVDIEPESEYSSQPDLYLNPLIYTAHHHVPLKLFKMLLTKCQYLDPHVSVPDGGSTLVYELKRTKNTLADRVQKLQSVFCEAVLRNDRETIDRIMSCYSIWGDQPVDYYDAGLLEATIHSRSFTVREAIIAKQGIAYLAEKDLFNAHHVSYFQQVIDTKRFIPIINVASFPMDMQCLLRSPSDRTLANLFILLQLYVHEKKLWDGHDVKQLQAHLTQDKLFDLMRLRMAQHERTGQAICFILAEILLYHRDTFLNEEEASLLLTHIHTLYEMTAAEKAELLFLQTLEKPSLQEHEPSENKSSYSFNLFSSHGSDPAVQKKQERICANMRHSNCNKQIHNGQGERINKIYRYQDKWVIVSSKKVCIRSAIDDAMGEIEWTDEENNQNLHRSQSCLYENKLISLMYLYESTSNRRFFVRELDLLTKKSHDHFILDANRFDALTLTAGLLTTVVDETTLTCWDFTGEAQGYSYDLTPFNASFSKGCSLKVSNKYLICLVKDCVIVIDRNTHQMNSIRLSSSVKNATLHGDLLICCMNISSKIEFDRFPNLVLIDLVKMATVKNIVLPQPNHPDKSYVDSVSDVIAVQDRLFFILDDAHFMMLDLKKFIVTELSYCCDDDAYLLLKNNHIFFIASDDRDGMHNHRMEMWDISSQPKLIYNFKFRESKSLLVQDVYVTESKFYFAYLRSLLSFDFDVDHQLGEVMLKTKDTNLGDECRLL